MADPETSSFLLELENTYLARVPPEIREYVCDIIRIHCLHCQDYYDYKLLAEILNLKQYKDICGCHSLPCNGCKRYPSERTAKRDEFYHYHGDKPFFGKNCKRARHPAPRESGESDSECSKCAKADEQAQLESDRPDPKIDS